MHRYINGRTQLLIMRRIKHLGLELRGLSPLVCSYILSKKKYRNGKKTKRGNVMKSDGGLNAAVVSFALIMSHEWSLHECVTWRDTLKSLGRMGQPSPQPL